MPDQDTINQMRTAIAALTGRRPVSRDPAFLQRRLEDLLKAKNADGKRFNETSVVVSISMHGRAKLAAARIAKAEGVGVSELVRRALSEFAEKHGHAKETANFAEED